MKAQATKMVPEEDYPTTLELKESQLEQIKNWKVGGKYRIIVEVEQISQHKGMGMYDDKGEMCATFKVLSAKSAGESKAPDEKPQATRNDKLAVMDKKAKQY